MGLKACDETINVINRLTEKFEKRLTLSNLKLAQRFLDNELRFLIHFRPKDSSKEWACCLLPVSSVESLALKQIALANSDKVAVLIDIIHIMETPKRRISTLIWFERVNRFYSHFPRSLYFSSLHSFVIRGLLADGEPDALSSFLAYRSALSGLDELKGKMVQRTAKVLQNVSRDSKYLKSGDRQFRKILDRLSRLRVCLGSDHVSVSIAEGFGLSLEISEVLFGPFDFYADQNEPRFG
ncbi:MAG TPA: hypothetical protein VNE63_09195 [Candidatus Acidoferrales bacterium]|nr:hypothetical protein [Candidatus Acidoferrales bacterium]